MLDCTLDKNIEKIQFDYGLKGFAIVVKLFQKIYGEFGYYCEWDEKDRLLFALEIGLNSEQKNKLLFTSKNGSSSEQKNKLLSASKSGSDNEQKNKLLFASENDSSNKYKNLINQVVCSCINEGIFSKELFYKYRILTSLDIQEKYFKLVKDYKKVKVVNEYLLLSAVKNRENTVFISLKDTNISNSININNNIFNKNNKLNNIIFTTTTKDLEVVEEVDINKNNNKDINLDTASKIGLILNNGEEYFISYKNLELYKELYPDIDIVQELRSMKAWLFSNRSRRKNIMEIDRFITNWFIKATDKYRLLNVVGKQSFISSKSYKPNNFTNFSQRDDDLDLKVKNRL